MTLLCHGAQMILAYSNCGWTKESCKICNFYRTSSVTSMFHQLGWKKLETRHYNSYLSFLFMIIHNLTCVSLSDITNTTSSEPTIMTRSHANNTIAPFTRTDTYQYSFGPSVCNNWNNLPSYSTS